MKKSKSEILEMMSKVAALARLKSSGEKQDSIVSKCVNVLDYIEKLGELDTNNVEPTSHAVDFSAYLREDKVVDSSSAKEIVGESPNHDETFIHVPRVIDSE